VGSQSVLVVRLFVLVYIICGGMRQFGARAPNFSVLICAAPLTPKPLFKNERYGFI
jgi:hypothetical protein